MHKLKFLIVTLLQSYNVTLCIGQCLMSQSHLSQSSKAQNLDAAIRQCGKRKIRRKGGKNLVE